ncbi:MAG: hypothetical protein GY777_19585 [Candidatus Brocadiaceae bacterium]|jgi:hypothetical protein|nr:hypothetical protein [Candidatus Brocadiaceae bacterium]
MKNLFIFLISFLIIFSCKKNNQTSFQDVVENGGMFDDPINSETRSVTIDTVVNGDSLWACTTESFNIVKGLQEFPLFNPNSSVVYPGNLLQGGSLKNATPDVIVVDRAPGTFSIDMLGGTWNSSATVNEVVKSEVVQALNDIIYSAPTTIPANISFSMQEVHTERQLALSLGVDFTAYGVAIQSDLGFSSNHDYNRVLVRLSQSYYTMSFDLPASYDDLFAPTVTPQDLEIYIGPGNPACYISDVTYGRVFYLLVESTSSTSNITSSINASFSGMTNGPSANISANYLSNLDNLNIKLFALGGDALMTLYTISSANVNSLVTVLGAAGDITTGVPLSYVCRAVNGNKIVSVNLATNYDIEDCEAVDVILSDYGIIPDPFILLDADDAILSNNGNISFQNNIYNVGTTINTNIGGRVVESWPSYNGIVVASTSNPKNRPVFVNNAINGRPAIEFTSFFADGVGNNYDQNISTFLDIPGVGFVNNNYTLFLVMATPTELSVHGDYLVNDGFDNQTINAGVFLQGSDDIPYEQLSVGFLDNSTLVMGHNQNDLECPISRSNNFRILICEYSQEKGMSFFVGDSPIPLIENELLNLPLTSNNGLKLQSVGNGNSRTQVAEIVAFDVALTDADRLYIASKLKRKYSL